tara:strand:+ start:976 stop:2343 length:1368 start_codon:yes stop_codon:yes gene_type:complete
MTKKIFEELPARKHAPAKAAPAAAAKGEGNVEGEGSEKKIRQAVYDIRYRARREGIDLRAAYSQYMSNSNLSAPEQAAVRAKLFGKDGGGDKKESYDAAMTDGATSAVAKAMFKVFAEKKEEEIQEDATSEKKYKVRVTDKKSGRSYVRYADRQKITELRAKGLDVEMTEHGDPYEGKKKEGGKMDPVAKKPSDRDGDVNNDGKKDGTDKYIYNRRDAINAAIAKKKAMKEEFLVDGTTSTEGQNKGKITGTGVDNYKSGVVKVMPTKLESASKLQDMIAEKKKSECAHNAKGEECEVHGMKACPDTVEEEHKQNCGCGQNPCVTYGESKEDKKEKECTPGERRTYRELLKAKMRAMGIKRPLILDMEPGEEKTMKAMTSSDAKLAATCEQVDERSPEANAAKQEAAKREAQKRREAAAKPKSDIEREGAAQRNTERVGKEAMRRALQRNPNLFK